MNDFTTVTIDQAKLAVLRGDRKQKEVAESVGITPQRLWNYESGSYRIPADVFVRLCLFYNVQVQELIKHPVADTS